MRTVRRASGIGAMLLMGGIAVTSSAFPALAETKEVRIAQQFGIGYLPLNMLDAKQLLQKRAAKAGLGEVKVSWSQFGGGSAMNDALLSGNLDLASGGVGPMLTIWDKTKGNIGVKGVACLNNMPLFLVTTNPSVKSLKDFTEKDRIALPAVKVSIQSRTMQMAAEAAFGDGRHEALDKLTVSMKHPDALAAMLSGGSEITGYFGSPPYQYQAIESGKARRILSSYDVLGGPSTFNCVWASEKFRGENPKAFKAFLDALKESMDLINADKKAATKIYIDEAGSKLAPAFLEKIVADPEIEFTAAPRNTFKYAAFMHKAGALKNKPESWKDYFFPEAHDLPGS